MKKSEDDGASENILRITDELVYQVNRTKKFVLIMIIAIVVAVPVLWHVAEFLNLTPDIFSIVGYFTIGVAAVFLGIGVRQWLVLSKWTKKYKTYKELQRQIDEKLDFEGSDEQK